MKTIVLLSLIFSHSLALALTSQEALDLGMTPLEEFVAVKEDFSPNFDYLLTRAKVVVHVDKSIRSGRNPNGQTVKVYVEGRYFTEYEVSTGTEVIRETTDGRRYIATTPIGIYRPTRAYIDYMSRSFLGAPMTWAVFFTGGIALHSTTRSHYHELGYRASGGCVRMRMEEAQELNELITSYGEPHFRTVDQSEEVDGVLLKRTLYINRDRFPQVDRLSGAFMAQQMWSYDALIVVTGN